MRTPPAAVAIYATLALTDTVLSGARGRLAAGREPRAVALRRLTKPLLMPTLACAFAGATRGSEDPLRRATLVAEGLSGVGDVALLGHGDAAFLTGLTGFLGAHVAYATGFAAASGTVGASPAAGRRGPRAAATLFLVAGPAMGWAAGRTSPRLRMPVLAYAGALCAMAATASGVGPSKEAPSHDAWTRRTLLAGTSLFLVSDGVLGAREFVVHSDDEHLRRMLDVTVMATYTSAQGLIATGVARAVRSRSSEAAGLAARGQDTGTTRT